ncbi:hypothetical protein [Azospirillum soli]|uniref:hypothetical protein n=1 Tax=Azospirillum soli TaxID=1304799 RepID=UPI001AE17DDA|nr:hypothetical protein [Azospirillum soli]MBP2311896.1 hypothetical protein [Azospirillum soli]
MTPFSPSGDSVDLAVSTSSARVALPAAAPDSVRITNPSSLTVNVRFGTGAVSAATSTGMDLLPGAVEVFRVPIGATHIAGITAAGSATLRITPGQGA